MLSNILYIYNGVVRRVMIIFVENGLDDSISITDEAACILHIANTPGKGMNLIILLAVIGK